MYGQANFFLLTHNSDAATCEPYKTSKHSPFLLSFNQWWIVEDTDLGTGDTVTSQHKTAHANLTDDGNFCVFHSDVPVWCTNTSTGQHTGDYQVSMQVRVVLDMFVWSFYTLPISLRM